MADNDFISRALASLSNQMALANAAGDADDDKYSALNNTVESHAKALVDDDTPKIDSAVKSYLSLVAARSVVASEIDVLSENVKSFDEQIKLNTMDMKSALLCTRKLLNGINTTMIPKTVENEEDKNENGDNDDKFNDEKMMMDAATRIVWNRLIENKDMKPSKILGRKSLKVAWPYIKERFCRGVDSDDKCTESPLQIYSTEFLPAIAAPQGIDKNDWIAYYTEFGDLLNKACQNHESKTENDEADEDDSKLLWSDDKGVSELQQRRDRRAKRAEGLTQSENVTE